MNIACRIDGTACACQSWRWRRRRRLSIGAGAHHLPHRIFAHHYFQGAADRRWRHRGIVGSSCLPAPRGA
jgi:hypothetical protein